ncbi:MAG: acyltransferase [Erysipelotrichia bacterium]|nr:acyltransferase [Erysipelotrichia bacterium]
MKYKKEIIITLITFLIILFLHDLNIIQSNSTLSFIPVLLLITFFASYLINHVDNQCIDNHKHNRLNLNNIDIVRFLFAIIIIILHVRPFIDTMDQLDLFFNNMISRICVPLFFITTGYFVAKKEKDNPYYITQYIKSMLPLYLIWSAIYLPLALQWLSPYFTDIQAFFINLHLPTIITLLIFIIAVVIALFIALIYIGTFYHLWYFPALLIALFLLKKWKQHFSLKVLLILSLILLMIGASETYFGFLPETLQKIVSYYFTFFLTTRNFLFFALFYITLGYYMGNKKDLYANYSCLKLILCIFLLIGEVIILQSTHRLNSNILLACIPLDYYLFITLLYSNNMIHWQPNYSFRSLYKYYYLIHPFIIFIIQFFIKDMLGYQHFIYRYEIFELIIIIACTHLASISIITIKKKYPKMNIQK